MKIMAAWGIKVQQGSRSLCNDVLLFSDCMQHTPNASLNYLNAILLCHMVNKQARVSKPLLAASKNITVRQHPLHGETLLPTKRHLPKCIYATLFSCFLLQCGHIP